MSSSSGSSIKCLYMKSMFVIICCHVNITDVCCLDTNTITNKDTKANTKTINFDKNTNTDI